MLLSEAVQEYTQYGRLELSHSQATFYSYSGCLSRFARWLEENGHGDPPLESITPRLISRYLISLSGKGRRPRTVCSSLNAIRCLFHYAHSELKAIPTDPALEVAMPKKDDPHRLLVSDHDLQAVLEAVEKQRTDFRIVRDRAVLATLVFTAIRRTELLDVQVTHVNLPEKLLLVEHGKGDRSRQVPLCQEVYAALSEWVPMRLTMKCKHPYLFCSEGKRRLGELGLAAILENAKAIAGLRGDPRIKPHSLRHAAATRLLRNGADLQAVSEWLGHRQLSTTAIYLHAGEERIREVAELAGFKKGEPPAPAVASERQPETRTFFQQRRISRSSR